LPVVLKNLVVLLPLFGGMIVILLKFIVLLIRLPYTIAKVFPTPAFVRFIGPFTVMVSVVLLRIS